MKEKNDKAIYIRVPLDVWKEVAIESIKENVSKAGLILGFIKKGLSERADNPQEQAAPQE